MTVALFRSGEMLNSNVVASGYLNVDSPEQVRGENLLVLRLYLG